MSRSREEMLAEEMARAIYESIFADSFDDTRGIERAQYMQAGEACAAIAQKRVNELEELLVRYGDRVRMARAEPAERQQAIDAAFENVNARAALPTPEVPGESEEEMK